MIPAAWLLTALVCAAPAPLPTPPSDDDALLVDPTPTATPARVELTGAWQERVTSDLAWDPGEHPFEAFSELTLGAHITPSTALEFTLAGRLRHRLLLDDAARVTGVFEPELREAALVWRVGAATVVAAGYRRPSWLHLVDPAPPDLRRGPFMDGREAVPVLAAEVSQAFGPLTLGALWLPLYTPARVPLGAAPWGEWAPAALVPSLAVEAPPDLADLADYPGPRADGLTSSELGVIARLRTPAIDLTAAWLWRWDRASAPLGAAAMTRQHVVGLGAAFPTGPLRWTAEFAVTSDETAWTPTLTFERRPFLRWELALGITPALPLDLTLEVHGTHAFGAVAKHFLDGGPNDVGGELWIGGRMLLMLAFDGILRLDARGGADALRKSWDLDAELAARVTPAWELALGLGVAAGDRADGGVGGVFAARDRVWLRSTFQL